MSHQLNYSERDLQDLLVYRTHVKKNPLEALDVAEYLETAINTRLAQLGNYNIEPLTNLLKVKS